MTDPNQPQNQPQHPVDYSQQPQYVSPDVNETFQQESQENQHTNQEFLNAEHSQEQPSTDTNRYQGGQESYQNQPNLQTPEYPAQPTQQPPLYPGQQSQQGQQTPPYQYQQNPPATQQAPYSYGQPPVAPPYQNQYQYQNQPINGVPVYSTSTPQYNGPVPDYMPYYGISFPDAIRRFFTKYATFSGRASKSEYWFSILFVMIVSFVISFIGNVISKNTAQSLSGLWSLATLIPLLSVGVRRLHDANKSGGLIAIPYVCVIVGSIILIVGAAAAAYGALTNSVSGLGGGGTAAIFGLLALIAGGIVGIVLMCLPSNPAGARYDRPRN